MTSTTVFTTLLQDKPYLLADGATGTNLFNMGLITGDSPELWNTDHPERIKAHYRSFAEAGSDIVLTNSFGGTRNRLRLHDADGRVEELNKAAAVLGREVAAEFDRPIAIAGSMGPTGDLLEPNGPLTIAEAEASFYEQALGLQAGGVDVLWIETMSSVEEITAAVNAASRTGLPVVFTASVDTNGRTMMGVTPADLIQLQEQFAEHTCGVGTNCGVGASEVVATVLNLKQAAEQSDNQAVLVAKANCGIPEYVDGKIVYNGTPEIMQRYVKLALDAGAKIIGGCCGTSPEHVKAMREAMDAYQASDKPSLDDINDQLGEVSAGAKAQLSGDMSVAGGSVSGGETTSTRRKSRRRQ